LESEGCATACRVSTARVGATDVGLSMLAELVATDRLAELAHAVPPPQLQVRASTLLLGLLLSAILAFLTAPIVGGLLWELGYFRRGKLGLVVGAACGVLLGMLTTWSLVRGRIQAPRLKLWRGATEAFGAITEQWRTDPLAPGVPPDPLGPVREWIDECPAPADPVGPTPDVCPRCKEALEADDEDPLSYCYHCGGQLGAVPRAPERGRWSSTRSPRTTARSQPARPMRSWSSWPTSSRPSCEPGSFLRRPSFSSRSPRGAARGRR